MSHLLFRAYLCKLRDANIGCKLKLYFENLIQFLQNRVWAELSSVGQISLVTLVTNTFLSGDL